MRKIIYILSILFLIFSFVFTSGFGWFKNSTAYAVGDLSVDWGVSGALPIFDIVNMVPGQVETHIVRVSNGAATFRPVGVMGIKTQESGNLGEALMITISENGNILYGPKTLSQFFAESSKPDGVKLSDLNPNQVTDYLFKVEFDKNANNQYQNKNIKFDLKVGVSIPIPQICQNINFPNPPIFGTSKSDVIHGTSGNDLIFSLEGNDTIFGGGGDDCIISGKGNDVVFGQNGDDKIILEDGNDVAFGGLGNDQIFGGSGNDVVFGDSGDDILNGGADKDVINGGGGKDTCQGETKSSCEF